MCRGWQLHLSEDWSFFLLKLSHQSSFWLTEKEGRGPSLQGQAASSIKRKICEFILSLILGRALHANS